jgi:uncharacterized repeat protein (TIGR02543 family)
VKSIKIGKAMTALAMMSMLLMVLVGCLPDIILKSDKTVTYVGNGNTSGTAPIDDSTYVAGDSVSLALQGDLERNGYTFEGWSTSADGYGTIYIPGGMLLIGNSNITLYAKWTPNSYTVTFDAQGGTDPVPELKTITYDSTYGALATTTNSNFGFAGWWTGAEGTGTEITAASTVSITTDTTLYAHWSADTFTVTFDAQGGTDPVPASRTVAFDSPYGPLATTTKINFGFAGWWTGTGGTGTEITAASTVSIITDTTLYAHWSADTFTVTFDAQGGTAPAPASKAVTFESTYGPLATTTRPGRTFAGWWTGTGGTGTEITAASTVDITTDTTFYAKWTPNSYTVTFDAQGGTAPVPASKTVTVDSTYGSLATTSRTGWAFDGWWTGSEGTGTEITAASTVSITSNTTLYAKWTPNTYTVTFDAQGGTTPIPVSKTVTVDSTYGLLSTTTRTGWSFDGWWTGTEGTGTQITAESLVSITDHITLYAKWTPNTYTVTFDAQGGTTPIPASKNVTFASTYGPLATTTRAGRTFDGWWTGTEGTGTQITAESLVSISDDITLYAKWTPNAYTVTFDAQGGTSPNPASKTVTYGSTYGALATTTKTDRTFGGWWTGTEGTGTEITAASIVSITSNITLYANWLENSDIRLTGLTFTRPTDTDFRNFTACSVTIMNYGPANLSGETVLVEFYLSGNTVMGDSDDVKIGEVRHDMTAAKNAGLQYTYGAQNLSGMSELWTADSVPDGSYYLYAVARVEDGDPADPLPDNNAYMATSAFSYTGAVLGSSIGMRSLSADPVDLSTFNDALKYSIVSATPSTPVEGSGTPSSYSFTLATTSSPGLGSMLFESRSMVFAEAPDYSVFSAEKKYADMVFRAEEERLLKSGLPQLGSIAEEGVQRAAPAPIEIGSTWNAVNIVITEPTTIIDTTCRYISDHAYFFVDNRDIATMEALLPTYGAAFDDMYSVMHENFGIENDVDGNGKVIILFTSAIDSPYLGYFYAGDKYAKTKYTDSNERDIFYLTTTASIGVTCGTLAHEFQHMIYFDQHYNEGIEGTYTWLNEALSQAAEYVTGYTDNHLAWIRSFLHGGWQGLSLTYWTSSNYGYGAIFIRYLIDQFGESVIKEMCSTANVGIHAVEMATGQSFNTIFSNFLRALVIDGTGDSLDSAYEFQTLDLLSLQSTGRGGLLPAKESTVGENTTESVHPYGINFQKWRGSFGTMALTGAGVVGTAFGASQ